MSENKEEFEKALNETLTNNSKERLLSDVLRLSGDKEMVKEYKKKTKFEMEKESIIASLKEEMEEQIKKIINEKDKLYEAKVKLHQEKIHEEKEKLDNEKEWLNQDFNSKIKIEKNIIAKNMINKNIDLKLISEVTGLTIDEIETL